MSEKPVSDEFAGGDWTARIDDLAGQVKMLALNLAITLARTKNEVQELKYLEPEFTQLIHGSVDVIREITTLLKAFRNQEKLVYEPGSGNNNLDRIETSLNEILNLSRDVLKAISDIKKRKGIVDNYK